MKGRIAWKIRDLHEQYGPVVRISHDELSFTTSGAWRKIYTQRSPEFSKCLDGRGIAPVKVGGKYAMPTESQERHGRLRRAVNPAFSERALREQEDYLIKHTDNLMSKLRSMCKDGPIDVTWWFNLCAFDIVSGSSKVFFLCTPPLSVIPTDISRVPLDLSMGQAAGALDNADQTSIRIILNRAKAVPYFQLALQYHCMGILEWVTPKFVAESRRQHIAATNAKLQARINSGKGENKDWMSYILDNQVENLTNIELVMMASTFLVAGSGTAAGGMAGISYLLMRNPEKMAKLCHEIRSTFRNQDEITMLATQKMPYLNAVLEEGMRLYPPVPASVPRWVPANGEVIEGKWVPGGTAVGCPQLACGHSELNFKRAREFIPERWLELPPGSEFANDDKAAMQPFSMGPRNCIGKA